MARQCTGCEYVTDEPFQNNCPICGGSLAIVCRSAGNRRSPGPRTASGPSLPSLSGSPWASRVLVLAVVILAVSAWSLTRANRQAAAEGPAAGGPGKRVAIGVSVRQAVLALEPVPDTSGRVSLHDLLAPDAPTAGRFTWTDGRRMMAVSFRKGKVTAVHETDMGNLPFPMPRTVTIDAADDEAGPAPGDDADDADEPPLPPRRKGKS